MDNIKELIMIKRMVAVKMKIIKEEMLVENVDNDYDDDDCRTVELNAVGYLNLVENVFSSFFHPLSHWFDVIIVLYNTNKTHTRTDKLHHS